MLRRWGPLDSRHGPASAAAEQGRQRYFPIKAPFIDYIVLNANRPLFRDVRLRRAVNYALDRPKLAQSFHDEPGDQIVTPAVDGFPAGAVYPVDGPDLETARRLAGNRDRKAVLTYCTFFPFGDDGLRLVAPLVKADLARIGIDVSIVRTDECPQEYDASSNRADLLLVTNFGSQVPDALPFLDMALNRGRYRRPSARGRGTASRSCAASKRPVRCAGPRGHVRTCVSSGS